MADIDYDPTNGATASGMTAEEIYRELQIIARQRDWSNSHSGGFRNLVMRAEDLITEIEGR